MGGPGSGRRKGSGKGIARKSNKAFLAKLKKKRERVSKSSSDFRAPTAAGVRKR